MNGYRIVERFDGGGKHYPIIQAVLNDDDWFPPVQAFEYQPADAAPYWLLMVDPNVVRVAGIDHFPAAATLSNAEHAREWVELVAALYVKASA